LVLILSFLPTTSPLSSSSQSPLALDRDQSDC
jgi:hypothetical protein